MNHHLLLFVLTVMLLGEAFASQSKVYVWRNDKGEIVYSDQPQPGAKEVTGTIKTNVISTPPSPNTNIQSKTQETGPKIVISTPQDHATIRDNTGTVVISANVLPKIVNGQKIRLFLDNEPFQKTSTKTSYTIKNVDRGEHKIKMELLNDKGKVIALSKEITFYLHRATVNTP